MPQDGRLPGEPLTDQDLNLLQDRGFSPSLPSLPGAPLTQEELSTLEEEGFTLPAPPGPTPMQPGVPQPGTPVTGPESPEVRARFERPTVEMGLASGGADYPDPRGFRPTPTVEMIAKEFGISTTPPPEMTQRMELNARALANLGIGTGGSPQELREVQYALQSTLGVPVEVRVGPQTGELEYRVPGQDNYYLFNQPGFQIADVIAATPEAMTMTAQALAGLGGAAVGGKVAGPGGVVGGVALAEAVATFGAELVKGKIAIDQGLPINEDDVYDIAFQNAGLSAAGAIALPMAAGMFKRLFGRIPRQLQDVDLDALSEGLEVSGDVQRRFRERGLQEPQFTAGPLSGDEAVASGEEYIARRSTGRMIRELNEDTDTILQGFLDQTFQTRRPKTGDISLGEAIQAEARRGPEGKIRAAELAAEAARRAGDRSTGVLLRQARPIDRAAAGARSNIRAQRDAVFEPFDERYDALDAAIGGLNIQGANIREAGERYLDEQAGVIFPSILDEAMPMVKEAARAGTREEQTLVLGPNNVANWVTTRVDEPIPLRVVQKDISNLRDMIRNPNVDPKRKRVAQDLLDATLAARNEAIDDPATYNAVLELERDYRRAKDLFDRGFVGEVLQTVEGGGYRLKDEQIVRRVLNNWTDARAFAQAAAVVPENGLIAGPVALRELKDGILGELQRRLTDRQTERGETAIFETFMRNHRPALQEIFSPEELARFTDAKAARQFAEESIQRTKDITNELNKTFGMKMQSLDPDMLVEQLMDKPARLAQARQIVGRDPDLLRALDGRVMQDIFDDITVFDPGTNQHTPTLSGISRFLTGKKAPIAQEVFGEQYIRDLTLLRDTLVFAERQPTMTVQDVIETMRASDSLRGMARFLRVQFPPLTRGGRALSATTYILHEAAQREFARAVADPFRLSVLLTLRNHPLASKEAMAITGGTFGPHVVEMFAGDLGIGVPRAEDVFPGGVGGP